MKMENSNIDVEAESAEGIPKEFRQIMRDFLRDLFTTFPEYKSSVLANVVDNEDAPLEELFTYVKTVFPQRFFDILYKNDDIFTDSEKSTEFLPGIDFADIWKMDDVSDTTKETIWRYLQLIMFSFMRPCSSR